MITVLGQKACNDVCSFLNDVFFFQVTRQLFEPLVMQLIHWFTNNKKFESEDTVAVLEAILVICVYILRGII